MVIPWFFSGLFLCYFSIKYFITWDEADFKPVWNTYIVWVVSNILMLIVAKMMMPVALSQEPFYPIDSTDTDTYSFQELFTYIIAPIAIHMFWSKIAYSKK